MDTFVAFFSQLAALVPTVAFGSALIATLVDIAKRVGLKDGYAPLASAVLNVVLYGVVFFAGDAHLDQVKGVVGGLTLIAPVVLSLFGSLVASAKWHDLLTEIGIGLSLSERGLGG